MDRQHVYLCTFKHCILLSLSFFLRHLKVSLGEDYFADLFLIPLHLGSANNVKGKFGQAMNLFEAFQQISFLCDLAFTHVHKDLV